MIHGDRRAALRALHDMRVVRASAIHPGYQDLYIRRFASRTPAPGGLYDYRLTPEGEQIAKEIFR